MYINKTSLKSAPSCRLFPILSLSSSCLAASSLLGFYLQPQQLPSLPSLSSLSHTYIDIFRGASTASCQSSLVDIPLVLCSMEYDDWDLQAVVRGCCTTTSLFITTPTTTSAPPEDSFTFPSPSQDHDVLRFPDLFATQTALQDLQDLCKPFFSETQPPKALSVVGGMQQQQQQNQNPPRPPHRLSYSTHSQTSRSKRRKNQQKRVVCQVPAEGLTSDMWAWRKYGQKPIKGSPYPRGYYRCSSSKGCLARKQVERSRSDPSMFVITYTAEHNHPLPTHRNSLAGSTRPKYTAPEKPSASPTTTPSSLTSSVDEEEEEEEEELLQPPKPKEAQAEQEAGEEEDEELLLLRDMMNSDDMFMDLEELHQPSTTHISSPLDDGYCFSPDYFPSPCPWFSNNAATAAGGS